MWERRYGFPKPARNDAQVRVYTDADIERLILVARALKAGFRAGDAIHRDVAELKAVLTSSAKPEPGLQAESPTIGTLLAALRADDAASLRSGLRQAVATLGPRQFLIDVAGPLVEQVGKAWAAGRLSVRHEHLVSEALSTQLRLLLAAYEAEAAGPVVLLATLSHEQHGLGLEMAALYLALHGASPRLLGVDTPPDQIVEAAIALNSRVVGVGVSPASGRDATVEHVRWMLAELPANIDVWLGGSAAGSFQVSHPRLRQIVTWSDVDRELGLLGRARSPDAARPAS
jgi:methanogenic corrinoid protein MtbC1